MSLRCLAVLCLSLAVQSAHIGSRNIPVEVVYENGNPLTYGTRNLDARIQLSSDELLKFKLSDDIIGEVAEEPQDANQHGVRNLDEKIQLSPDELGVAVRFLPHAVEQDEAEKAAPQDGKPIPAPAAKPQDNENLVVLLKKAEEVVYSGVNSLKDNFEKASEAAANAKPGPETWKKLNKTLNEFFVDQYKRVNIKADNAPDNSNNNENNPAGAFIQGIANNFQILMNNFQGTNPPKPQGSEDEQTSQQGSQNFIQTFVTQVMGGFSGIINNANSQNNGTTGQEDTGTGGGGGNNFLTSVGNFFQGIVQGQGSNPSNQSDTGVPQPSGPFQVFQQTFTNVISSFNPQNQQSSAAPPTVQGDEGTASSPTTSSPGFGIGSINQAFASGVQTIGQLGQGGSAGSGSGGTGGLDQLTSIGNQIGQQLTGQGGTNPVQQAIGQFTGGQGGEQGNNPIQAIGSQLTGGQATNPIENIQNALGGAGGSTQKKQTENQKDELVSPAPTTSPKEVLEAEKKPAEVAPKAEEKLKPEEVVAKVEEQPKPAEVAEKVEKKQA